MNKRFTQQVNPKVTAIVILAALTLIQVFWWRGLVMKTKPSGGGGGGGGGGPQAGPLRLRGREEVQVSTFSGAPEPGDADGMGRNARFDGPTGLAIDKQGNLYVADSRNHRIRRIAPDGETTTVAGGEPGFADGPVGQARFHLPSGVAVGPDGALYVADTGNHRVRRIKEGQVTTLAGSVPGMAEGRGAAARFDLPSALSLAPGAASLLVADSKNWRVRTLTLDGATKGGWAVPGAPTCVLSEKGRAVVVPQAGACLIGSQTLRNIAIDTQGETTKPGAFALRRPVALCPAPDGWFVTDAQHCAVFYLRGSVAEVFAGECLSEGRSAGWQDATGEHAAFGEVSSLVYDGKNSLYVSDTGNNCIRRITWPLSF